MSVTYSQYNQNLDLPSKISKQLPDDLNSGDYRGYRIIAEVDDKVVGCARYTTHPIGCLVDWAFDDWAEYLPQAQWVDGPWVRPEYRGMGIAKETLNRVSRVDEYDRPTKIIVESSADLIPWYQDQGFREVRKHWSLKPDYHKSFARLYTPKQILDGEPLEKATGALMSQWCCSELGTLNVPFKDAVQIYSDIAGDWAEGIFKIDDNYAYYCSKNGGVIHHFCGDIKTILAGLCLSKPIRQVWTFAGQDDLPEDIATLDGVMLLC